MANDYLVKEIKPKNGVMKEIHEEVLGCRCYILDLTPGQRGWIKFEPRYDPGCFHRLHTSLVHSVHESEDGSRLEISTENTVYILESVCK